MKLSDLSSRLTAEGPMVLSYLVTACLAAGGLHFLIAALLGYAVDVAADHLELGGGDAKPGTKDSPKV